MTLTRKWTYDEFVAKIHALEQRLNLLENKQIEIELMTRQHRTGLCDIETVLEAALTGESVKVRK